MLPSLASAGWSPDDFSAHNAVPLATLGGEENVDSKDACFVEAIYSTAGVLSENLNFCTITVIRFQLKGARYLLIIHELLVAMDFFYAGVQDETLEEESQRLAS